MFFPMPKSSKMSFPSSIHRRCASAGGQRFIRAVFRGEKGEGWIKTCNLPSVPAEHRRETLMWTTRVQGWTALIHSYLWTDCWSTHCRNINHGFRISIVTEKKNPTTAMAIDPCLSGSAECWLVAALGMGQNCSSILTHTHTHWQLCEPSSCYLPELYYFTKLKCWVIWRSFPNRITVIYWWGPLQIQALLPSKKHGNPKSVMNHSSAAISWIHCKPCCAQGSGRRNLIVPPGLLPALSLSQSSKNWTGSWIKWGSIMTNLKCHTNCREVKMISMGLIQNGVPNRSSRGKPAYWDGNKLTGAGKWDFPQFPTTGKCLGHHGNDSCWPMRRFRHGRAVIVCMFTVSARHESITTCSSSSTWFSPRLVRIS